MTDATWSEERVRSFLAEHEFPYQNVELPYDLQTGGKDLSSTAASVFPEDLSGKSLLDIGCKYSYFCFEVEMSDCASLETVALQVGG